MGHSVVVLVTTTDKSLSHVKKFTIEEDMFLEPKFDSFEYMYIYECMEFWILFIRICLFSFSLCSFLMWAFQMSIAIGI